MFDLLEGKERHWHNSKWGEDRGGLYDPWMDT